MNCVTVLKSWRHELTVKTFVPLPLISPKYLRIMSHLTQFPNQVEKHFYPTYIAHLIFLPDGPFVTRFTLMVLRHKHCLMYTRTSIKYGCYCGVTPGECGETEDCLDNCCKHHGECFDQLPKNCSGLEPYHWEWDEGKQEV